MFFFLMIRRPPRSTRTDTLFPTRRSSDLLLDATRGLEVQDLKIASNVLEEGRALVIALNKWDVAENASSLFNGVRGALEDGLSQAKGWYGEGRVYPGFTKDDTQWDWWMAYYNQMTADRKSGVEVKSVSGGVDLGGRRNIKKKTINDEYR